MFTFVVVVVVVVVCHRNGKRSGIFRNMRCVYNVEIRTDRQMDRQRDTRLSKHAVRWTEIQTGRWTDRQAGRETERQTTKCKQVGNWQTDRQTDRQTDAVKQTITKNKYQTLCLIAM